MSEAGAGDDRRWPRAVYGVGQEPDPRFSFANERTFLAWIRTGLGFLTAGIALVTVSSLVPQQEWQTHLGAGILIGSGLVCGVVALLRWLRNERALRLQRPLPAASSLPVLTVVLVLVALTAALLLVP